MALLKPRLFKTIEFLQDGQRHSKKTLFTRTAKVKVLAFYEVSQHILLVGDIASR